MKIDLSKVPTYDLVGEYDHYMAPVEFGDYYLVEDIEKLIKEASIDIQ